jgi:predicted transcriptional regulator
MKIYSRDGVVVTAGSYIRIERDADYVVLDMKEARWLRKILKKAIAECEGEVLVLEETVSLEEQLCAAYGELSELLAEYFQK